MMKWIGFFVAAVIVAITGSGMASAHPRHHHYGHGVCHHRHHHHRHHFHHHAFNQDNIFYTELGAYYDTEEDHPDIDNEPVYWLSTQDEEPAYFHHHAYVRRHFHH